MNIVIINTCTYGSTGKIIRNLSVLLEKNGHHVWCATSYERPGRRRLHPLRENDLIIGDYLSLYSHVQLSRITGLNGCYSRLATRRFLKRLAALEPDVINLHNLHNSYINIPLLFSFIKKKGIKVVWTLHDCWPYTGHCTHYTMAGCDRWKTGCHNCPQLRAYPETLVDTSALMYRLRKKWFTGIGRMVLVTPSEWMAGQVRQSFLGEYPVEVINNGLDLSLFRERKGGFRAEHDLQNRKVVLGVSSVWNDNKGLDVFIRLAALLPDNYRIVLVGTDSQVDRLLPPEIISVHKTDSVEALTELYSMADVYVNPSREESFGMTTVEALACGTPAIMTDVGGAREIIDSRTGIIVKGGDAEAVKQAVLEICEKKSLSPADCREKACCFDKELKFREYLELFERM